MRDEFDMSHLIGLNYSLGLEFNATMEDLVFHQRKYMSDILKRFNVMNYNSTHTPKEANSKLIKDEDGKVVDIIL